MTLQKTLTTNVVREPLEQEPGVGPAPNPLLAQAQGFAEVARAALRDCERGAAALDQMQKRRNGSGQ